MKSYIRIVTISAIIAMLLMSSVTILAAPAAPPVVDGLLNGTNNVDEGYTLSGSSADADLYVYRSGTHIYLAMVVPKTVNDNVFDKTGPAKTYVQSAGWSSQRFFTNLINSEKTTWNIECTGDISPEIAVIQKYAGGVTADTDPDTVQGSWTSPIESNLGGATVVASSSSIQYSMNNYTGFDITPYGSNSWSQLKSPSTALNTVPPSHAAGTFDTTYNWEWRMIYEIQIDVSGVTACESVGSATPSAIPHHSPTKGGDSGDSPPVNAVTLTGFSANADGMEITTFGVMFLVSIIIVLVGFVWYRQRRLV